jgi:chromosome segregation and condensation protein ScpB
VPGISGPVPAGEAKGLSGREGFSSHKGVNMTKLKKVQGTEKPDLKGNLERIEEDLEIMERHSADLADVESGIQSSMKKRDREFKDTCLHSVPKALKHSR